MSELVFIFKSPEEVHDAWVDYKCYDVVAKTFMDKFIEKCTEKMKQRGIFRIGSPSKDAEENIQEFCSSVIVDAMAIAEKKRLYFWDLIYAHTDKNKYTSFSYNEDKKEVWGVPK